MSPIQDMKMDRATIVGRVARGYKKELSNGKTQPVATPYFIIKEELPGLAERVHAEYGSQPEMLRIRFLSNSPDRIFQHYREEYMSDGLGGGKMRCQGDGEMVTYRRFIDPERDVDAALISGAVLSWGDLSDRQDEILSSWQTVYGISESCGNSLVCMGKDCPRTQARKCRPTGRLVFAIEGIGNPGEWQMRVHAAAIPSIYTQLEQCKDWTKMLLGVATVVNMPWHLCLGQERKIRVRGIKSAIKMYPVIIQPDAEWFSKALAGRISLPLAQPVTIHDVWGEEPERLPPPTPLPARVLPALDYEPIEDEWPGEEEEPVAIYTEVEEPESEGQEMTVLVPEAFKERLLSEVKPKMMSRATQPQQNYIAAMLNTIFGNGKTADLARHEFLEYLFGEKSVKKLNKGQAHALIDWLKTDEARTVDDNWEPSPLVVAQCNAVIRQRANDEGQQEMFEDEPPF